LNIRLEAAPEREADEIEITSRSPFSGARVSNFTAEIANRLRADPGSAEGVVIINIADGSSAQRVGLRPGDIVLEVNGLKIESTGDLERATRREAREWRLVISRGGQRRNVVLRG